MGEREFPEDWYTGPQINATDQLRSIILTSTGQVERRNLASMTYKFTIKDTFGNEVQAEGEIFGRLTDE